MKLLIRTTILLFCYVIYVNEDYKLTVCEPELEQESKPLIEVTEGDGYKEKEPVTYEELVKTTQQLLYFDY